MHFGIYVNERNAKKFKTLCLFTDMFFREPKNMSVTKHVLVLNENASFTQINMLSYF